MENELVNGAVSDQSVQRRPSKNVVHFTPHTALSTTPQTPAFQPRNFEDILYAIKPHSTWQHCVLAACIVSLVLVDGLGLGQPIFIIGHMDYECVTYEDGSIPSNFSQRPLHSSNSSTSLLASGHLEKNTEDHDEQKQAKSFSCTSPLGSACTSWKYSSPYYVSTMVSEWNLVCSRSYLRSVYQSCFLGGYLVGMFVLGALADAYGRTFVIQVCTPLVLLTYVGTTWAPAFWLAACMRTIYGALHGGDWIAKCVLIMEISVPEQRNFTSTIPLTHATQLVNTNFIIGGAFISIIGYFVRDWRKLQLVGLLIAVGTLPFTFLLPESPRWLVTQEKYNRALAVLKRAAKMNRSVMPVSTADLKFLHDEHLAESQHKKRLSPWQRIAVIFASRQLLIKTLIFFVVWFIVSNVYYGITFYGTGVIPGNPYFTFGLMNLVQFPFIPVQLFALRRLGPRTVVIAWFIVSAAFFAALAGFTVGEQQSIVQHVLCIGLVVAGNIFIDNCFTAIYIVTGEIYPTVNRQTGMSLCSMMGRVGGAVSPFIANSLGEVWRPLPAIIFSALCIVAAFFVCLLPNTKNFILPDSVRDTVVAAVVAEDEAYEANRHQEGIDNFAMQVKDLTKRRKSAPAMVTRRRYSLARCEMEIS